MKKASSYRKSDGTLKKRGELGVHISGKEFSLRLNLNSDTIKKDFEFVDLCNGFRKVVKKK
jgi:hypothetical protein